MNYIIDFIDWLYNTITSIFDFFIGFIENTIMLVEYLGIVANICYSTIATMPVWLQAFATITVVVSVLYMILGRTGGGSK